jgi:mono/diheme cytochrome c family protein
VRRFFLLTTLALVPALFCSAPAMAAKAKPKTAAAANGAYPLLPAGPGRDVEIRVCSQCHSPDRPAAQRHDLAGWNVILDQMATNGAKASDAEFDQIAAYLTRAFPPGKK